MALLSATRIKEINIAKLPT